MRRGPFPIVNRAVNPGVKALLRSPLHRLVSGRLLLLTYTGRKSGRRFTIPTGYSEQDGQITITIVMPEKKVWWRNLREPGPVTLRIKGSERQGTGRAIESEDGSVRVEVGLGR